MFRVDALDAFCKQSHALSVDVDMIVEMLMCDLLMVGYVNIRYWSTDVRYLHVDGVDDPLWHVAAR